MGDPVNSLYVKLDQLERDRNEKHVENVTKLTRIETALEATMERLFGNGQPGVLDRHEKKFKEHDDHLSKHDKYVWMILGAMSVMEVLRTLRGMGWLGH